MNPPLHVEVVQKRESCASKERVEELVRAYLSQFASLRPGAVLQEDALREDGGALAEHAECVSLCALGWGARSDLATADATLAVHVFKLDAFGGERDTLETAGGAGDEPVAACEVRALPAQELHGLWESLVFDDSLKEDTVRFVEAALELAALGVGPHEGGCGRVLLLHGPPGTGKTSLCRALAHKLAVRLGRRYPRARLLEINAHGLFSKWFSESGKLVGQLFERVHEIAADPRLLAVVLVDEVESLAHARRAALAGLEPSDSIRAVNALLTQLDALRARANVLVLSTSNVTGAIDVAFADRADIKRRVGPPSARAAYEILRACCAALQARGALRPGAGALGLRALEGLRPEHGPEAEASLALWEVAVAAARAQLSGRALRRLPFLAYALQCAAPPAPRPPLPTFVNALDAALRAHLQEDDEFRVHEDTPPSRPTNAPDMHTG